MEIGSRVIVLPHIVPGSKTPTFFEGGVATVQQIDEGIKWLFIRFDDGHDFGYGNDTLWIQQEHVKVI